MDEVEGGVRLDEVVDEAHRHASRGEPHALLRVGEDDVIAARLARAARLSAPDFGARVPLQLERDVLGHVPQPGPLAEPHLESAGATG